MGVVSAHNVYDETWLVFFFMKILGLYPAGCCSVPGTGYVYVLIFLLIYNALFMGVRHYTTNDLLELEKALGIMKLRGIRYILNTIFLHVIVISTSYQSSKIKKACREIDNVDKGFKYLNISIDHTFAMKRQVVRTLSIIVIVVTLNLMEYYSLWNYQRDYMYVLMWIMDRVPDFINTILICSHAALAAKVSSRFAKINRALELIVEKKNCQAVYKPIDNNSSFRWKLLKFLSMRLQKTIGLINQAYGLQLILLAAMYLSFTCLHFNIIYLKLYTIENPADVAISLFWGPFDLAKFLYIITSYRLLANQYT